MQRLLTADEIADFLSRNPQISQQQAMGLIPSWGVSANDSVYGNVVVFQGADGNWYYSGWTGVDPSAVNAPIYESGVGITAFGSPSAGAAPPCNPNTGDLSGFLCGIQQYATTALSLIGLWILYEATK